MKSVLVDVKSIQRDAHGEDVVVEMFSNGRYYEKNNAKYIIYNETEATGMEGVQTTIKVLPNSIVLLRTGKTRMRQEYEIDKISESLIETPAGAIALAVKTHELESTIDDGQGEVHLGYDISIGGEWQFYNQIIIKIREDHTNGNERHVTDGH